jgi:hypothetical protein
MRLFNTIDVTRLLPQVRCPTLVLHSVRDVRVPFSERRLLATSTPGAEFVPIDSPNHLLLEHEPGWQQWLRAIDDFLPRAPSHRRPVAFAELSPRQREILEPIAQATITLRSPPRSNCRTRPCAIRHRRSWPRTAEVGPLAAVLRV